MRPGWMPLVLCSDCALGWLASVLLVACPQYVLPKLTVGYISAKRWEVPVRGAAKVSPETTIVAHSWYPGLGPSTVLS